MHGIVALVFQFWLSEISTRINTENKYSFIVYLFDSDKVSIKCDASISHNVFIEQTH